MYSLGADRRGAGNSNGNSGPPGPNFHSNFLVFFSWPRTPCADGPDCVGRIGPTHACCVAERSLSAIDGADHVGRIGRAHRVRNRRARLRRPHRARRMGTALTNAACARQTCPITSAASGARIGPQRAPASGPRQTGPDCVGRVRPTRWAHMCACIIATCSIDRYESKKIVRL